MKKSWELYAHHILDCIDKIIQAPHAISLQIHGR